MSSSPAYFAISLNQHPFMAGEASSRSDRRRAPPARAINDFDQCGAGHGTPPDFDADTPSPTDLCDFCNIPELFCRRHSTGRMICFGCVGVATMGEFQ